MSACTPSDPTSPQQVRPTPLRKLSPKDKIECHDLHDSCKMWAKSGECEANRGFMVPNCPVACDECEFVLRGKRLCHRPSSEQPLLRRGGVHATFERVVGELSPTHHVKVLSAPPHGPWVRDTQPPTKACPVPICPVPLLSPCFPVPCMDGRREREGAWKYETLYTIDDC